MTQQQCKTCKTCKHWDREHTEGSVFGYDESHAICLKIRIDTATEIDTSLSMQFVTTDSSIYTALLTKDTHFCAEWGVK